VDRQERSFVIKTAHAGINGTGWSTVRHHNSVPFDEPFINSREVTITALKKVKQFCSFATYERLSKYTTAPPSVSLKASSWGFLLSAVFS
jgi:hypothetical protein